MLSKTMRFLTGIAGLHPVYAHYGVTHRCNLRCRMCAIWRTALPSRELSVKDVRELARILRGWGVVSVSLGGGEPLLREDIAEIVSAFSGCGVRTRLLTNGVTGNERLFRAVAEAGLDEVSVSLDSLKPERQEWVYRREGVLDGIKARLPLWRRLLERGVLLLNCVVSNINLEELPELVEFARSEGYFISFVPIALAGEGGETDEVATDSPEFAIPPERTEEVRAVYRRLLSMKTRGYPIINSSRFLRKSCEHLSGGRGEWKCDAGRLYLSIDPSGLVSPCHRVKEAGGKYFKELGRNIAEFRRKAAEWVRRCRGCMRPCWAEVSFLATARGLGEFSLSFLRRNFRWKMPG